MLKVSTTGASTLELDHATIDYHITNFIKSMDLVGPHGFARLSYHNGRTYINCMYMISRNIFLDS